MNTNEINSKYTTVESINNRLNEIRDIYNTISNNVNAQEYMYKLEVDKFLYDNGITDWKCRCAHDHSINLIYKGEPFYTIEIFAQYKETWVGGSNTPKLVWTYTVNVASYSATHITEPTKWDIEAHEYYKMIGRLFVDSNFSKELENLCKRNVNEILVFKNAHRELRNEEYSLNTLREKIKKTENAKKFLESVKTADKNMFVIINKYEDPEICVATYRKKPCIICCEPNESEFELTLRCKEQNKCMGTNYNVVQIKNLKF